MFELKNVLVQSVIEGRVNLSKASRGLSWANCDVGWQKRSGKSKNLAQLGRVLDLGAKKNNWVRSNNRGRRIIHRLKITFIFLFFVSIFVIVLNNLKCEFVIVSPPCFSLKMKMLINIFLLIYHYVTISSIFVTFSIFVNHHRQAFNVNLLQSFFCRNISFISPILSYCHH